MGHYICYVASISGTSFNNLLPEPSRATSASFQHATWESAIPGSREVLHIVLDGVVTTLTLGHRYTQLLAGREHVKDAVAEMDRAIAQLVGPTPVYRCDEWLLDQWALVATEWWFRNPAEVEAFHLWLEQQDSLHWTRL